MERILVSQRSLYFFVASALLLSVGCHHSRTPPPSRFQEMLIGKWRDEHVQFPVTDSIVTFEKNGTMTITYIYSVFDKLKCTLWATYKVLDDQNGSFVDVIVTHKIGTCGQITAPSGSLKLDMLNEDHILLKDLSLVRTK